MFPWMKLNVASIMCVTILHIIIGAMIILSKPYLLANGIKDEMMILLVVANSTYSAWAMLMCHLLLSSYAVVDE